MTALGAICEHFDVLLIYFRKDSQDSDIIGNGISPIFFIPY